LGKLKINAAKYHTANKQIHTTSPSVSLPPKIRSWYRTVNYYVYPFSALSLSSSSPPLSTLVAYCFSLVAYCIELVAQVGGSCSCSGERGAGRAVVFVGLYDMKVGVVSAAYACGVL